MNDFLIKKMLSMFLLVFITSLIGIGAGATGDTGMGTYSNPYVVDTWAELSAAMTAGGYVKLAGDIIGQEHVSSSSNYWVAEIDKTVSLDLNGHTIKPYYSSDDFIKVNSGGHFGLWDSSDGSGIIDLSETANNETVDNAIRIVGGSFVMNGGNIVGKRVCIDGNGQSTYEFLMYGGSISSASSEAVLVKGGTFNMGGGTLANNGYGVRIESGTFNMEAGSIAENIDGVQVYGGEFFLYGKAKISENTSNGVYINDLGKVTLNGGTISGNGEWGIYDCSKDPPYPAIMGIMLQLNGGTISGNKGGGVYSYQGFKLSGTTITGNTDGTGQSAADKNVVLRWETKSTEPPVKIRVTGVLSNRTIGVRYQFPQNCNPDEYEEGLPFTIGLSAYGSEANFVSEMAGYDIGVNTDGEAVFIKKNASDSDTTYSVWVGGVQVSDANKDDILGDGSVSYTPAAGTLTFANGQPSLTGAYLDRHLIFSTQDIIINVPTGGLKLTGGQNVDGISGSGTITINGDVTVETGKCMIVATQGITVNGSVSGSSQSGRCLESSNGDITVTGNVDAATLNGIAFTEHGSISIGGNVSGSSTNGDGLCATTGSVEIEGDVEIEAAGDATGRGIYADPNSGTVTISGDVTIDTSYRVGVEANTITASEGTWHVTAAEVALQAWDSIEYPTTHGITVPEGGYVNQWDTNVIYYRNSYVVFDSTDNAAKEIVIEPLQNTTVVASGLCGDNLTWKLDDNGKLTISGTGMMSNYNYDSSPAPWEKKRTSVKSVHILKGVTGIGKYAFYMCENMTNVIIPEGVAVIGEGAFYNCEKLSSVSIPEGVTSIGSFTFDNCYALASVTIPDGVKSIGSCAFYSCWMMTSVTIPDGVTSIGDSAFGFCSSMTSITIPSSVTSIDRGAFDCRSLKDVYYSGTKDGANAIEVGTDNATLNDATWHCSDGTLKGLGPISGTCGDNLTWKLDDDGKLTISGTGLMSNYNYDSSPAPWEKKRTSIKSVVIIKGVTGIGKYAFYMCENMTNVIIPEGVAVIGEGAFYNCEKLSSVSIPEGVTSIGSFTFDNCYALASVTIPDGVKSIGSCAFYSCWMMTSVTIPDGVTSIGDSAFGFCSSMTSITIPSSVTSIDRGAFDCRSLKDVYYGGAKKGANAIEVGTDNAPLNDATWHCSDGTLSGLGPTSGTCGDGGSNLTWMLDNKGLLTINGTGSLNNFDASSPAPWAPRAEVVNSVMISDGVTSIGNFAFDGCDNLTDVYYKGTPDAASALQIGSNNTPLTLASWHYPATVTFNSNGGSTVDDVIGWTGENITAPKAPTKDGESFLGWYADGAEETFDFDNTTLTGDIILTAKWDACALGHDLVHHDAKAATCTEIGWNAYDTCKRCDYTTYAEIAALGHDLVHHDAKAANCTEIGWNAYDTCKRCDYTTYAEIAALGHKVVNDAAIDSTCTETGLTSGKRCSVCNEVLEERMPVPAKGHSWDQPTYTWADDHSAVNAKRFCGRQGCGAEETETVSATSANTTPATCTAKGKTTYTSGDFQNTAFTAQSETVEDVAALGHDWGTPTYTWADDYSSVTAKRVCGRQGCGEEETETVKTSMTPKTAPTNDTKGETEYTGIFTNTSFATQSMVVEDIPALKDMSLMKLPAKLEIISDEAFANLACEAIIIPDGCKMIGARAFADCRRLIYINIPASVTSIATDAFEGSGMVRIYYENE